MGHFNIGTVASLLATIYGTMRKTKRFFKNSFSVKGRNVVVDTNPNGVWYMMEVPAHA